MFDFETLYTLTFFSLMVLFLLWRPHGLNEAIPPTIGAIFIFIAGIVPLSDVFEIFGIVSGASITIISTIIMSIVLDSIGFFRWAAFNLVNRANGSGIILYWYTILLCFLMTMFFNNDGSILITTPIIINIVTMLKLKPHQQFPYLLSGALVATASSAPIAVSNLANLIALEIVGLNLNLYVSMMFVPSMIGITTISLMLYYYFKRDIPKKIRVISASNDTLYLFADYVHRPVHPSVHPPVHPKGHPHHGPRPPHQYPSELLAGTTTNSPIIDRSMFKVSIAIVALIRVGLFVGASFNIPIELIGIIGALMLIGYRWYRKRVGPYDIVKKTPWHIILFAFSIYIVIYGMHNIGLTGYIIEILRGPISANYLSACLISGGLLTLMSNLFNNLPAVMIGTFTLSAMNLDLPTLHIAYLANIIGADIGSLITPMGTLATLIWIFLLRKNGIKIRWADIMKVTIRVIPIGLIISLLSLYFWVEWLFY
ncbi:MAG: ArsB/NhaD family transporter [Desulfosporosinus sp.]|jgi:arsenical pump membrane protein